MSALTIKEVDDRGDAQGRENSQVGTCCNVDRASSSSCFSALYIFAEDKIWKEPCINVLPVVSAPPNINAWDSSYNLGNSVERERCWSCKIMASEARDIWWLSMKVP